VRPTTRLRWLAVPAVGLASSQLGHLVAYQARYGRDALRQQSVGDHLYFPAVAGSFAALLAAALIAGLLALGAARLLLGRRRGLRSASRAPLLDLVAVLFTFQLGVFLVQEVGEALLTGLTPDAPPMLFLWGSLGQLPVALLAALALSWLSARLEAAIEELGARLRAAPRRPPVPAGRRPQPPPDANPLLVAAPVVFRKRGPPDLLR